MEIMETKMKKFVKVQHMAGPDVCSSILLTLALCAHFLWMYGMTIDATWLIDITKWTVIPLYLLAGGRIAYTFWRAWRRCEPTDTRPEGEIVLSNTLDTLGAIQMFTFMAVLFGNFLLYTILPAQWIPVGATVLFLGGVAFVVGATIFYLVRYHKEQHGQAVVHSDSPAQFFIAATRYLDHILVSENVQIAFNVALALVLLDRSMPIFLSDGQYQIFHVLMQSSLFMFPIAILFEFLRLRQHHDRVVKSHPHHTRQNRTLSQLALAAIFTELFGQRLIYAYLPMHTADVTFLAVSIVIALALVGTSIYFRIFRSKYVKASTLAW